MWLSVFFGSIAKGAKEAKDAKGRGYVIARRNDEAISF
jgi:hypothetical protein